MIRIAIQAKGRLNEESIELLKLSGIKIDSSKRKLLSKSKNFPMEILYLRDDDIPNAVNNGIADIGIVGLNEIEENELDLNIRQYLDFSKCRLSLAIPKEIEYENIYFFQNKTVATSYPNILRKYFKEKNIECKIEKIAGSVEIAPSIGMTDGIFDIVSSGSTLISNGLKEVEVILRSEAVLISKHNICADKLVLIKELEFRIESIIRSKGKKYMLLNIPNNKIEDVINIIPGMKSPTIIPLTNKDWSAIHTVINENEIWEKISQLKKIGAEDILILSLENLIL